ncbi:MAG TPA: lanthionine synthetase LanC family protein [Chloroflexia bacterium]|nr:lanthionine synthetase LanC family protein [Chloroflexia bacterium]
MTISFPQNACIARVVDAMMSIVDYIPRNANSSLGEIEPPDGVLTPAKWAGASSAAPAWLDTVEDSFFDQLAHTCQAQPAGEGWVIERSSSNSGTWLVVRNSQTRAVEQGWKLHISANVNSAIDVLSRALPVLLAERAAFKVAASIKVLARLNDGELGPTQIGKFITVYPDDDGHAVRLARALVETTRGLQGPVIPSDRPLAPDAIVYYRYGGFRERYIQDRTGAIHPAIKSPEGNWVADNRDSKGVWPEWAPDPFIAAGIAAEAAQPSSQEVLIARRYLLISLLHRSAGNDIFMSVDLQAKRPCVLKRARQGAAVDLDGLDAVDRLRNEAAVLARLAPDPRFPSPLDLVEQEKELFLVMNDLGSRTLEAYIGNLAGPGLTLGNSLVAEWGSQLASMLRAIHDKHLVHGDVKTSNIIVSSGSLCLLDFELACEIGSQKGSGGRGTRGYMSPQQASGLPLSPADDIYSLGAILYFLATKAEPSQSPQPFDLLRRSITTINPAISPVLIEVIARCRLADTESRYASMSEVEDAIARASSLYQANDTTTLPPLSDARSESYEGQQKQFRDLASRLGDTLVAVACELPGEQGITWESKHPLGAGRFSRDINIGSSGTVLALAELASELNQPGHVEALARGADGLRHIPSMQSAPLPGLYVGEGGLAAAWLRAGQVLSDERFVHYAEEKSRWIAAQPYSSPDLFNGTAGRLRLHLLLWQATTEKDHLRYAVSAGEQLLSSSEQMAENETCWRIPDGFGPQSGSAFLGYAHGAAGIADALLDLYEVTSDERFFDAARRAARWLVRQVVPALNDQSGVNWPAIEGGPLRHPFWCHGATGIARFLLHAAQLHLFEGAEDLANRAARMSAWGARQAGPTQCHGLAGNIELLLDFYQVTGHASYLSDAYQLADLLTAFSTIRDGNLAWFSDAYSVCTPDYMVGYAGVAVCLLRLANPSLLPHQLSLRGFQAGGGTRSI